MQRFLIGGIRTLGLPVFYGVMGLVIPFYMLFGRQGYLSMYHFLRERFHLSPLRAFVGVYKNHYRFGQIILDRFAVYGGMKFQFTVEGYDLFYRCEQAASGVLLLSCHVGNYELAGYSLQAKEKRFNALVFSGETETVMNNRKRMLTPNNMRMIPVKEDLSHVFLINNALSDGEIVSMPADRLFGSSKSAQCTFFGTPAKFPLGPFATAVQREVPVLAVFVMKSARKSYRILVREIYRPSSEEFASLPRRKQMEQAAQRFATELEAVVKSYPEQWFNYYNFWAE
jgi:predicted LPLAT superfamily acyltransferase